MKTSYIAILTAAGLAFSAPASAWAACSPTVTPITDGISVDVSGCHLQIQNPPIIPIAVSPVAPGDPAPGSAGLELVVRKSSTGEVGSDGGVIIDTINANTYAIVQHSAVQDAQLSTHNDQIIALQDLTTAQGATINAHSALLSQHSKLLDEQAKGLAIAMAMPDTWLSDKQRFAIAGGVGGFGDETAIGFSMIGRLNETWSLNAGLGSDTSFEQFGWKAGVRAGW